MLHAKLHENLIMSHVSAGTNDNFCPTKFGIWDIGPPLWLGASVACLKSNVNVNETRQYDRNQFRPAPP